MSTTNFIFALLHINNDYKLKLAFAPL